jgi:serine/threonine protein phosphatase PrpC
VCAQLEAAISAAFCRLDREIKAVVPDGTTATFCMLKRAADGAPRLRPLAKCVPTSPWLLRTPHTSGGVGIKTAWVGDSRAVLARYTDGAKTVVQALTRDHKASDVMEAARIEAFYAALARRPASTRNQGSDGDDGSVRLSCSCRGCACC